MFRILMHIVTCSNYFDLNKIVVLRTGGGGGGNEKRLIFANFRKHFRVICPFRLHKIHFSAE